MIRMRGWFSRLAMLVSGQAAALAAGAEELAITSFEGTGQLTYNTLNDGTNYSYRVEWAPAPSGPWSEFGGAGAFWLNAKPQAAGAAVTNTVPICYRVVATLGDYLMIDVSGGTNATSYPVTYYRTLADLPISVTNDAYKTTNILMRLIPKGTFAMGSPAGELGKDSYETRHTVTLTKDFYLGVFEVTQRQWELVTGNKPSYFNNATYYATRPVEQVSYYDIRENPANSAISPNWPATNAVHAGSFMGRLRAKTGLTGFDLPTESQWEYACRAGTATALNSGKNLKSTSSDANVAEVGRYWYNGGSGSSQSCAPSAGTAAVGSYAPNAWGLYDMHGNVWEWCLDWYGIYPGAVTDPPGASSGSLRVFHGGCWVFYADYCRSANRDFDSPGYRDLYTGFRACCAPPGQP